MRIVVPGAYHLNHLNHQSSQRRVLNHKKDKIPKKFKFFSCTLLQLILQSVRMIKSEGKR